MSCGYFYVSFYIINRNEFKNKILKCKLGLEDLAHFHECIFETFEQDYRSNDATKCFELGDKNQLRMSYSIFIFHLKA